MAKLDIEQIQKIIDAFRAAIKWTDGDDYARGYGHALTDIETAATIEAAAESNQPDQSAINSIPCEHRHINQTKHETKCADCGADLPAPTPPPDGMPEA